MFEMDIRSSAERAAEARARRVEKMRHRRDQLLAQSDWTQMEDAPVDRAAWQDYRQALRDITGHPQWPDMDWPRPPMPPQGARSAEV